MRARIPSRRFLKSAAYTTYQHAAEISVALKIGAPNIQRISNTDRRKNREGQRLFRVGESIVGGDDTL